MATTVTEVALAAWTARKLIPLKKVPLHVQSIIGKKVIATPVAVLEWLFK
jgi:hypothetical protein